MVTKKKLKNKVKYLKEENKELKKTKNSLTESLKTTQKDLSNGTDKQVYVSLDLGTLSSVCEQTFPQVIGETRDSKEVERIIRSTILCNNPTRIRGIS